MRWAPTIGIAAVGIFSAIAVARSRRSRRANLGGGLGRASVDPFEVTAKPKSESTPAYYKAPKADEPSGCLLIGRKHKNPPTDEYRVCLTENQERVLLKGKKIGKKLGCGVFACAYALGRSKVVKFTHDKEDVAALLEAPSALVPRVYNVFQLRQGGHTVTHDEEVPVYALTLERLKTLSVPQRKVFDKMLADGDCASSDPELSRICERTREVEAGLLERGIEWNDVHGGNIGLDKHGNVKALDLGLTNTQLKQRIDVLAGRRPARPIKRHVRSV